MRSTPKSTTLLAFAALGSVAVSATDSAPRPAFTSTSIQAPFVEQFTDDWTERWTPSEATKKTPVGGETFSYVGKWSVEEPAAALIEGDRGLVAKTKAAHHAISAAFDKVLNPKGKTLVVQYEAKFQKGGNCGGGYIKLLEPGFEKEGQDYNDKTPWTIMFGPDMTCPGSKVHFIFRHENPINHEVEEKHLSAPLTPFIDDQTKLYTLIVEPDNSYQILVDEEEIGSGSLLENFTPAVNPPTEIDDPEDTKPATWVDAAEIVDPEASKPADWDEDAPYSIPDEDAEKPEGWLDDEPTTVADPDAEKPEEWDDEEDGDWIAPVISNPKCEEAPGCGEWVRPTKANPDYKGKWSAPMIPNPEYKGVWAPRKIANPNYFVDESPSDFRPIAGVGFEIWSMTEDILFDNIYVGHSKEDAKALAAESFVIKHALEKTIKEAEKPADDATTAPSSGKTFAEDPIEWLRAQAFEFIALAQADPVGAFKAKPETGAVLVAVLLTFFGSVGALFGLVGGSSSKKPVKVSFFHSNLRIFYSPPLAPRRSGYRVAWYIFFCFPLPLHLIVAGIFTLSSSPPPLSSFCVALSSHLIT
ncbi:Calreticulin-domain-containing protein [Clavulina sp. PMI_390]|nr:Calreticulin-domain-containing protein [Clavulina sp. PMI_390]